VAARSIVFNQGLSPKTFASNWKVDGDEVIIDDLRLPLPTEGDVLIRCDSDYTGEVWTHQWVAESVSVRLQGQYASGGFTYGARRAPASVVCRPRPGEHLSGPTVHPRLRGGEGRGSEVLATEAAPCNG
jgi:hypothetical protein